MSNYLSAVVNNEYFYTLPICNILPYNNGIGGVGSITGNTTTLYSSQGLSITIPDYIKKLDSNYISFSATPQSTTQVPPNIVVCQIVYDTGVIDGLNNFNVFDSSGTLVNLETDSEYIVEIRVRNGELLPIDIKNIKRIQTSTSSASSGWIAAPTNITLWKRFIKSDSTNKDTYLKDNTLPSGMNGTTIIPV